MGNSLKKSDFLDLKESINSKNSINSTDSSKNEFNSEPTRESLPSIYQYLDYRKYLKDCITAKKKEDPKFTIRELARRTGLSAAFISYVLRSKRNFNEKASKKVVYAIGLTDKEGKYFDLIRRLEITKDLKGKTLLFEEIENLRVKEGIGNGKDAFYSYYSDWIAVVIRELVTFSNFKLDAEKIKNSLLFNVRVSKVKNSIISLFESGYIAKDTDENITTPVPLIDCDGKAYKLAIREFHSQMLDRAKESLTRLTPENRRISGMTFPVSKESFPKVVELIKKFEADLKTLEEQDLGEKTKVINVTQFAITLADWESSEMKQEKEVKLKLVSSSSDGSCEKSPKNSDLTTDRSEGEK